MRIVVTGGAGYIGGHVAHALLLNGHEPIVIDDLSTGRQDFIPPGAALHKIDVSDSSTLNSFFSQQAEISGVIHLAGIKYAGESVKRPLDFYRVNTQGLANTLQAMKIAGIQNMVFSSSCSVYGDSGHDEPTSENSLLNPSSPYGKSKLFAEQILIDEMAASEIKAVSLRYFNVAGNGKIVAHDQSPHNLFPNIYRAIESRTSLDVFHSEKETRDGTCVRDYVDVSTLASAHIHALSKILDGEKLDFAYNLGSGVGTTTLEIAQAANRLFGINYRLLPARNGDPSTILADNRKASLDLNWVHDTSVEEMLSDGYLAWNNHKN
jgi:UDP-glucose 4-epimerase